MDETPPGIVLELSELTKNFLRRTLHNLPEDNGNFNALTAKKDLEAIIGYFDGTNYEKPKSWKNETAANKALSIY